MLGIKTEEITKGWTNQYNEEVRLCSAADIKGNKNIWNRSGKIREVINSYKALLKIQGGLEEEKRMILKCKCKGDPIEFINAERGVEV